MPDNAADRMPITSHLEELRRRIVYSAVALSISFVALFNYSELVLAWMKLPMTLTIHFKTAAPFLYTTNAGSAVNLIFTKPAEALWMHMKIAFVAAIFVSMPFILTQLWLFISPGLLPKERRYALPFVVSASAMFALGALFCQYFVLPFAIKFLLAYKTENLVPMISIGGYVDFCAKFLLAFGAVFQLPLVIMLLTRLGVVTPRFLSRNRKYAVLLSFVLAAVLTPTPDAFNMVLMAMPIMVLYEVGLLLSRLTAKRKPEVPGEEETSIDTVD